MATLSNERLNELNTLLAKYEISADLTHLYNIRFKSQGFGPFKYLLNSLNKFNADDALKALIDAADFIGYVLSRNFEFTSIKLDTSDSMNTMIEITKDNAIAELRYDRVLKVVSVKTKMTADLTQFVMSLPNSILTVRSFKGKARFDVETESISVRLDEVESMIDKLISQLNKDRDAIGL